MIPQLSNDLLVLSAWYLFLGFFFRMFPLRRRPKKGQVEL